MSSTNQYFIYDEYPARQEYGDLVILKTPASYAKHEILIELKYVKKGTKKEATLAKVDRGC